MTSAGAPRIAFVAGTLGQGGAEKQLVYMARALRSAGVDVCVYCLTRGEYYEEALADAGIMPVWIGRSAAPPLRVLALRRELKQFRPHIVQSAHFYTNLYVRLAAPAAGAIDIGAARNDVIHEVLYNGRWGQWLVRAPSALIVNSYAAQRNTSAYGARAGSVHVLPNVIDLAAFDAAAAAAAPRRSGEDVIVAGVGTFIRPKRFDRFLHVLARARERGALVRGLLVGDGRDRAALEAQARELGLTPDGVEFAGRRNDIPAVLRGADLLMLTSEHEGFPNVILEAMAASRAVISTAAGDADAIIAEGVTGFVVPLDAEDALVDHLCALAASRDVRESMGRAGRARVEAQYSVDGLASRLLSLHRTIAAHARHAAAIAALGN
ncbi:MAG TPA: glycosyltransferase [Gemmatimonadaceae bacterium]|nr:glycosyltransferase [Gemmatimonadaceae bacterium]